MDLADERVGLRVDDLDAAVAAIGDVDVALGVVGDGVRRVELPGLVAARADRLDEVAVLGELRDARIGVAVGDEDVTLEIEGDVGGPAEAAAAALVAAASSRRVRRSH